MKWIIGIYVSTFIFMSMNINCGCNIDAPNIPVDTTKTDSLPYEIIWESPQNIADSSGSFSPHFKPVIIGNVVLNANDVYSRKDNIDTITAYDLKTGKILWKWSDFLSEKKNVTHNEVNNGILYATNGQELVGIDGKTGQTVLRRISPNGQKKFSVSQDLLFHIDLSADELFGEIVYFNKRSAQWEKVVRVNRKDNFTVYVYPPTADIQPNGDTLLYFQNRFYQKSPYIEGSELYCYNMTKKEMVWNSMVDSLVSNINNTPYVDENRVYFCSAKTVHCFDKKTGERIWRTHFPETNFLGPNYLMTDDLIVIGSDNGERIGVLKSTGKVIYNILSGGSSMWRLTQYKDWLINVDIQLEIFDIHTGKFKSYLNSPRKYAKFNTGVAIDESTGLFYLPDGYNMMCIKVKGL